MPQGPTITIHCPGCRHPYPMTPTQLSVYLGRKMGCMACGRPFEVHEPPPEPGERHGAVPERAGVPTDRANDPPDFSNAGFSSTGAGTGAGTGASPGTDGSAAASPARTASPGVAGHALRRPTRLDRAGVAAAIACLVLTAAAATAGYAGSAADGRTTAQAIALPLVLLRLGVACAAAAVVIGAACLWRGRRGVPAPAGRRPPGGTGHGTAALTLGVAELAAAALLAFVAWPPMARALADGHRAACQGNLQVVGALLLSEATARADGRFPDSLADLVRAGNLSPAVVACPADPAPAADPAAGRGAPYVYLGKGLATKPGGGRRVSTHSVLAYESPGHHGYPARGGGTGGLHVLFADGSVVYVDQDQATALLAELAAGQNPPPSAGLIRR